MGSRLLALLLAALAAAPASAAPSVAEARLFALANAERAKAGREPLAWDEPLAEIAREHAADMRQQGEISHVSCDGALLADRVARAGLRLSRAAENVARAPNVEQAHAGLMRSPGHRANLLDARLTRAGFGVLEAGDGTWVVQDFGHGGPVSTEREAEAAALAEILRRGWAVREDDVLSRDMDAIAAALAEADTATVRGRPNPGCWMLGLAGPDPADLPARAEPSCRATRAGVGAVWARTPTRPLGAWFVALTIAP